jgi:hypothetical protein
MKGMAILVGMMVGVAAPASPERAKRFAFVVGASDGGPTRVRLRYASSDAQSFATVLRKLGGVEADAQRVILEPDAATLRRALGDAAAWIKGARGNASRTEIILYYSGHSDEEGLLLRGERVGYDELRTWLSGLATDVKVAIIDSCASGAITRGKGGVHGSPFLADASMQVRGHAYLTSSAADEVSQESDRLNGSFFTHFLLAGLRGAADTSRDGRITLNEAYQFAYSETLARTERARSGPQHPAYDIELSGRGDLVLTDLRGSSARLILPAAEQGRFFIRGADGVLVMEARKVEGRAMELGLDPGKYTVTREHEGAVSEVAFTLEEGGAHEIEPKRYAAVLREATVARGGGEDPGRGGGEESERVIWLDVAVLPGIGTGMVGDRPSTTLLSLGLVGAWADRLSGLALASVFHIASRSMGGIQLSGVWNQSGGDVRGLQLAGAANVQASGHPSAVQGAQVAGVLNVATSPFAGMQISGAVNVATSKLAGAQISVLNIADEAVGAQIGLINIARVVRGTQIGLFNYGGEVHGVPFGISYIGNGRMHVALATNEVSSLTLEGKFGTKVVHSILLAGIQPRTAPLQWSFGWGVGLHLGIAGPISVDLDTYTTNVGFYGSGGEHLIQTVRLVGEWRFAPRLALFAGPSASLHLLGDPSRLELRSLGAPMRVEGLNRVAWLGFAAGVQL